LNLDHVCISFAVIIFTSMYLPGHDFAAVGR
jgi:hypothetical protein